MPELVDHPGAVWELVDGAAEVLPGLHVVPTPGHVEGHQSLVVRCSDGTVVLAGQPHDHASDFSSDALAVQSGGSGRTAAWPVVPAWMDDLLALDPARVLFAHDGAVWEPV